MMPVSSKTSGAGPRLGVALLLGALAVLYGPVAAFGACLASGCHAGLADFAVPHPPASDGSCLACHAASAGNGEHPGGLSYPLVSSPPDLCLGCHDAAPFAGPHLHGPVATGACTYCHAPHGAGEPGLLRQPAQELCLGCHADMARGLAEAPVVHSAVVEKSCLSCHRPHSSEIGGLLRQAGEELCFECHQEIEGRFRTAESRHAALVTGERCGNCHTVHYAEQPALLVGAEKALCLGCHGIDDFSRSRPLRNIAKELNGKEYLHGPVAADGCVDCHEPHGTEYGKLIRAPYPGSIYAPYQEGAYDFCFGCHDRALLAEPAETTATGFRNGAQNLHVVHVVDERKGRTCQACHAAHASDRPVMIDSRGVPFGSWRIPLRFVPTDTGGSCTPGCHRRMEYDRQEPVDNSYQ